MARLVVLLARLCQMRDRVHVARYSMQVRNPPEHIEPVKWAREHVPSVRLFRHESLKAGVFTDVSKCHEYSLHENSNYRMTAMFGFTL